MRIEINGQLSKAVLPKDVILYVISKISASGGTGHFVEYAGDVFENMSMEGRMTVCNMSIEMGARGGMIAPDEKAISYLEGREYAPKGDAWDKLVNYWATLRTDADAQYDTTFTFAAEDIEPMITYGTNPGLGIGISKAIPAPGDVLDGERSYVMSLDYMDFKVGEHMVGKHVDYVFMGSCTNGRIEDFRQFAKVVKGRTKAENVTAWLVPGSQQVESKIKEEGIMDILEAAGFELRQPGCSACLAMNDDKIPAGKYAVSTSNRNFEGRQGPGSRTMLASPLVAAAAAITGKITDPRELLN